MAELSDQVREWVSLRDNIQGMRQGIKEMADRERSLKESIKSAMLSQEIDIINLKSGGKVSLQTRTSKGGLTSPLVTKGLMAHFENDDVQVSLALQAIEAQRTPRETKGLSIRKPPKAQETT